MAALAGCTTTIPGAAMTAPALPPAPELTALLPSVDEVNAAMGTEGMALSHTGTNTELVDDSEWTNPTECLAVSSMGQREVYALSGWTQVRIQSLHEPLDEFEHLAQQAVIAFPTPQQATDFAGVSGQQWRNCAGREYSYTAGDHGVHWQVGGVTTIDGILTTAKTQTDVDDWICQRALTAAATIVADVLTCSSNPTDSAARNIAQQIAAKATAQ